MTPVIIALLGIIGDLVKRGADAYADAQKQHEELVAAVESGLANAQAELDKYKTDHAQRVAAAEAVIQSMQKSG